MNGVLPVNVENSHPSTSTGRRAWRTPAAPAAGQVRIIGQSPAWQLVLAQARQVAATDATVLLFGASGTGKELVAQFIHSASPRRHGAFVAINCAALPEPLLESELFGYERGAFTGAHQLKVGQIELASEGTLFLDEVTEMSPAAQAKFLRLLQEREYRRLGGTRLQRANVRVIAASNRDLRAAVARGAFREDLYYRLMVFDISLPPLHERTGDIPLLARAFLDDFRDEMPRPPAGLSAEALDALLAYGWPGNVRELRNVLERAAILADRGLIRLEHLSLRRDVAVPRDTAPGTLGELERRTIQRAMRDARGNKSRAARALGLTRTQLYVRLRKHALESAQARERTETGDARECAASPGGCV